MMTMRTHSALKWNKTKTSSTTTTHLTCLLAHVFATTQTKRQHRRRWRKKASLSPSLQFFSSSSAPPLSFRCARARAFFPYAKIPLLLMSHTCNEWLHGSCSIWSLDVSMKCVYAYILRSYRLINARCSCSSRRRLTGHFACVCSVTTTTTNATLWTRTYANQTHDEKRNNEDDAQQIHHNTIKPKRKRTKIWGMRWNKIWRESNGSDARAAYNVFIWSHDAPVATQRTIKMHRSLCGGNSGIDNDADRNESHCVSSVSQSAHAHQSLKVQSIPVSVMRDVG